jgi:hypothetical protein
MLMLVIAFCVISFIVVALATIISMVFGQHLTVYQDITIFQLNMMVLLLFVIACEVYDNSK